jgi:hypothetical protein
VVANGQCGFISYSSGASVQMLVDASSASGNLYGVLAAGAGATVRFTRSSISGNVTGAVQISPGAALSYGNNSVNGNTTDGSFSTVQLQ